MLVPIGLTAGLLIDGLNSGPDKFLRAAPELLFWLAGMTLVLWGAAALAGRGRTRAAWWLGALGAIAVADLAVILTVVNHIPATAPTALGADLADDDSVNRLSAPLWLFVSLTDRAFGLPRPTIRDAFLITDLVTVTPFVYLMYTPYALAYVIGAMRPLPPRPAASTAAQPA